MTIRHHPSDETLLGFAVGTLAAGLRLVVAVHLAGCPACRAHVARLEAIGGIMLDEAAPAQMEPDAFARILAVIDAAPAEKPPRPRAPARQLTEALPMPAQMDACDVGPWRWLGPGRQWRRVTLREDPDTLVVLLRVGPGRRLPSHGHGGVEMTQVLYGSFADDRGRYSAGDFAETDEEIHHRPAAGHDTECVCLVALEAGIRLDGGLGWILRRLFGN
jgi:putative transcriptional regulator